MKKYSLNKKNIEQWKADVQKSVMFYNDWFLKFAPSTYINARQKAIDKVEKTFQKTECFNLLSTDILKATPDAITILRMATTPPLARDRLTGLADVPKAFVKTLEEGKMPQRMSESVFEDFASRILSVISKLLDADIMPWLSTKSYPHEMDRLLATRVIGDRVCGSLADPIIRNEQERRQLHCIKNYLEGHGYKFVESSHISDFKSLEAGTFSYHLNVPAKMGRAHVNMPIDVVVKRKNADSGELPILIECKSAGDFTNTNKRRKEEATKIEQLKNTYGKDVEFILFLCGYFDSGYLGYEAAEGIDWVWEHRIDDLQKTGI
ncbi:MAG: XamI family restriction endonuclease [Salinivirgaceae bacterium]|nr:XamI family restriction endonuclease [Salinivirgaceae bacterium]